ncbi:hypothetical protein ECANGB1_2112 [Enterospora canceri]|uniref:Plasmodium RESA N-terminal domain-containing protein n=1 Tax=Enterospora canceri TaxID=1081671 RepID=A0A1Y1S5U2_9MICR|nr:hypothetical protein ECANGB1_2112 [Enterospora canceri]
MLIGLLIICLYGVEGSNGNPSMRFSLIKWIREFFMFDDADEMNNGNKPDKQMYKKCYCLELHTICILGSVKNRRYNLENRMGDASELYNELIELMDRWTGSKKKKNKALKAFSKKVVAQNDFKHIRLNHLGIISNIQLFKKYLVLHYNYLKGVDLEMQKYSKQLKKLYHKEYEA